MVRIFVSYRRTDSDIAGRISDRLIDEFGSESVFLDVDNIPVGSDFRKVIDDAIRKCTCVLAVIGPGWIRATEGGDKDSGDLQSETDYVRLEVKSALAQEKPLVPVLVGSVDMPEPQSIPEDIRRIAFLNAASIRSGHGFRQDVDGLIASIGSLHPGAPARSAARNEARSRSGTLAEFDTRELVDSPEQLQNQSLGRYQLRRFIASGGGGAVFEAFDKNLHHAVCLKVAYPVDLAASDLKRVVSKGVRGLVQMKHAGVIPVFDFDDFELADGKSSFFLVMELSQGSNLASWTSRGRNDLDGLIARLECARQVTATLRDAHEFRYIGDDGVETVGVLHGDIKPNNILVESDGTPRLLDFLLVDVQRLQQPEVRARFDTRDHHTDAFGTPSYMAAEQETQGIITTRTDIYSWGQTLIDLFVMQSREAIRAKIAYLQMESSRAEEIAASIGPAGSSFLWGCAGRADMEASIIELIARCTAPKPENRPASMGEVLGELDRMVGKLKKEHAGSVSGMKTTDGDAVKRSPLQRLTRFARKVFGAGGSESQEQQSLINDADTHYNIDVPGLPATPTGPVYCIHCGHSHQSSSHEFDCEACGERNEELTCVVHHGCGQWTPLVSKYCRVCGGRVNREP